MLEKQWTEEELRAAAPPPKEEKKDQSTIGAVDEKPITEREPGR